MSGKFFVTSKMKQNPSSCSIWIWNYHLEPSKSKSRISPGPYGSPLWKMLLILSNTLISKHCFLCLNLCIDIQSKFYVKILVIKHDMDPKLLQKNWIILNPFLIKSCLAWSLFRHLYIGLALKASCVISLVL